MGLESLGPRFNHTFFTVCSSEMKREDGHLDRLLRLEKSTSVNKKACKSSYKRLPL